MKPETWWNIGVGLLALETVLFVFLGTAIVLSWFSALWVLSLGAVLIILPLLAAGLFMKKSKVGFYLAVIAPAISVLALFATMNASMLC